MPITVLKRRADFLALRNGRRVSMPGFLLLARQSEAGGGARVGLTVSKKTGGAVIRNRIRRRLRAAVREAFPAHAQPGWDYALIARKAAYDRNFALLLDDMKRALLRLSRSTK